MNSGTRQYLDACINRSWKEADGMEQVKRWTATKLMAAVAFGGGLGDPEYTRDPQKDIQLDVDVAANALRQAGYEVHRLPDEYGGLLMHPLDDFIEAVIEGPDDDQIISAVMREVGAIVYKFGGACFECGPIGQDYVPFADLFAQHAHPDLEEELTRWPSPAARP